MPVWSTQAFYDFVLDRYPEALEDRALWRLLWYLLRGWYVHRDRRRLQLPYQLLAAFGGGLTRRVIDRETYPEGQELLEGARELLGRDGAGRWRFEWSEAWAGRQPRLVRRLEWPAGVLRALEAERRVPHWEARPRVHWDSELRGPRRPFDADRYRARSAADLDRHAAELRPSDHAIAESVFVLDLLNRTPPNTLSRMIRENFGAGVSEVERHRDETLARAGALGGSARVRLTQRARASHDQQMRALTAAEASGAPRYFISQNSPRLFSVSDHVTGLRAPVRRALLPGLVEVDLGSCHLAVLGAALGLDTVNEFLRSGGSVWDRFIGTTGLSEVSGAHPGLRKGLKDVFKKEGLYPAMYGRSRGRVVREVQDGAARALADHGVVAPDGVGLRFVADPVIDEVLRRRDEALDGIATGGGMDDPWGRRIALPGHEGSVVLGDGAGPATVLCYVAGVVEMRLLSAAAELQAAEGGRRFRIQLWQHDGCSVRVNDVRRTAPVLRAIIAAVDVRAREVGALTRLEVEESTLPTGVGLGDLG